jgi:hypothetical protein
VKAESAMWRELRPHLIAAKLDPIRVENPIHPGTPDVNLCNGFWIEMKTLPDWPRPNLIVRITHFTPQQRVWLYRRWKFAPGSTHLLLQVRSTREWLLFDGDVAAKVVGQATTAEHRERARAIFGTRDLAELPKIFLKKEAVCA